VIDRAAVRTGNRLAEPEDVHVIAHGHVVR
jgi:hypothetical protein